MSEEKSRLIRLAARKRLLVAESELNRAEFLRSVRDLKQGFHGLGSGLRTLSSNVSVAAAIFSVVRRLFSGGRRAETRRSAKLFKGTLAGTALWFLLRLWRRKE